MNLSNLSALITGGSKGLGLALARRLAAGGAQVAVVARDRVVLDRAVAAIRDAGAAAGGSAHGLAFDIADKDAVHALAAAATSLIGPIDLLIHNASTLGPPSLRPLLDTDCEALEHALAVNLVGPFRLTKIVGGHMALRGSGTIVHISSDAAVNAYPTWGAYGAAKAAQDHLSRILAAELAATGVRVLAIDPGDMDTDLHRAADPSADPATLQSPDTAAGNILAILAADVPTGSRLSAPSWEST